MLGTLLVACSLSPDRAERWRTENKRTIRVIIGIIMVALGGSSFSDGLDNF
jgi:hypothetical protein